MLRFIPFEDDWDALERMRPEDLVPFRVGLLSEPVRTADTTAPVSWQVNPAIVPRQPQRLAEG